MKRLLTLVLMVSAMPVGAETVFAAKTLRPRDTITPDAILVKDDHVSGAARTSADVLGFEVRSAVYAGRPILLDNIVSPAVIERNDVVRARFAHSGLTIEVEARALERGAVGDVIRAMNLMSRTTIQAKVQPDGQLMVQP